MARKLKSVDAVIVGLGWSGSIMARELTKAGLDVVALERGEDRTPEEDFVFPYIRDELKIRVRNGLMLDTATETLTMRHAPSDVALPMRRWDLFSLGNNVGGGGSHWNGITWRFSPTEFVLRSHLEQRYGKTAIPADMPLQDWGVSYDELEPHYDRFEKLCGTSGKAGNLRGKIIDGGNPFEGERSDEYPNKPLITTQAGVMFTKAAKELGLHPFPTPASNASAPYTNPEGCALGQCQYCGHCEWFGCEANAKASPNICINPVLFRDPKFELRTLSYVKSLTFDASAKRVRGVVYVDRRNGEEIEQPADLVILCAYPFNNVLLMRLSGIGQPYDPRSGEGIIGKNYCFQTNSSVAAFVDEKVNPFIATGVSPAAIDDYDGDNFDHGALGFFGGGYIYPSVTGGRPIQIRATPPGVKRWGSAWKQATSDWYNHWFPISIHASSYAHRNNYLDLDPTYKDAIGRPLVRMTFNYTDNDKKMSAYLTNKANDIAKAMGAKTTVPRPRTGNFGGPGSVSSHHTGGIIMGNDPKRSALNRYLQSWDCDNLFVMGGAAFPQNAGHNPTGTIGALAYWSAKAIIGQYLKAPGPLVQA